MKNNNSNTNKQQSGQTFASAAAAAAASSESNNTSNTNNAHQNNYNHHNHHSNNHSHHGHFHHPSTGSVTGRKSSGANTPRNMSRSQSPATATANTDASQPSSSSANPPTATSDSNTSVSTHTGPSAVANGEDLSTLLGHFVRLYLASTTNSVTTPSSPSSESQRQHKLPQSAQGLLWAYDPLTSFVVLQTSPVPDYPSSSSSSSSSSTSPTDASTTITTPSSAVPASATASATADAQVEPSPVANGSQQQAVATANSSNNNRHPSFRIVKVSQITKVKVLSRQPHSDYLKGAVGSISIQATKERERHAIAKASRVHPKAAGQWGAEVYDALAKTLPVRWHDASIVVMDELIISPPYRLEDCKTPQSQGAGKNRLDRVRKVLEGERTRLLRLYPHLEEQAGGSVTPTPTPSNHNAADSNATKKGSENSGAASEVNATSAKADAEN